MVLVNDQVLRALKGAGHAQLLNIRERRYDSSKGDEEAVVFGDGYWMCDVDNCKKVPRELLSQLKKYLPRTNIWLN